MTPKDPVREALPARPMVIGNDRKARPQIWFKWPEVQAYARAAVAALPVQSAEPVGWQGRSKSLDPDDADDPWSAWYEIRPGDMRSWEVRLQERPSDFEIRPVFAAAPSPSPASVGDSWREAVDEALVINGLDCTSDAEPADRALRRLLAHEIAVATDPAINSPSPASAGEWRPISTAPKDAEIWIFNGEQGRMHWIEVDGYALWSWADDLLSDVDPSPEQPSHWRPLPTPPSTKGGEHD